jgi:glycosyltransferase 2 family protein
VESIHDFWNATRTFAGHVSDVGLRMLAVALCFQVTNLVLRATAWRNILRAALPSSRIRWRTTTGAYLAGAGVNAVVPARGGDVMKLFLVHRSIPEAHYPTIASTLLAETLFDIVVGSTLLAWAFSRGLIPGTPQLSGQLGAFEWSFFAGHGKLLAVLLAVWLIGLAFAMTWIEGHVSRFWDRVKDGLAILTMPERYLKGVVSLQALGWGCRVAAMYFFLQAFHVPADLTDAATALSAGSISTLMPLTPGGAGTQQALLAYMFRGLASQSTVLSFSVGMQFAITATTATMGGICLAVMLKKAPWKATRVPDQGPPPAAAPP